jgi:hypothetical protein
MTALNAVLLLVSLVQIRRLRAPFGDVLDLVGFEATPQLLVEAEQPLERSSTCSTPISVP